MLVSSGTSLDLVTLRRAQILCGSIRLIARDGVDRVRLKDIADEAGVSLGLVQHYFRTRRDLIEQSFETMMGLSLRAWGRLDSLHPDPLVKLLAGLRMHVSGTVTFEGRWAFWAELWSGSRREEHLAAIAKKVYEMWTEPMRSSVEGLAASRPSHGGPSAAEQAVTIMALIDGLAVRGLIDPQGFSSDDVHRHLTSAVCVLLDIAPEDTAEAEERAQELRQTLQMGELSPELIAEVLAT